MQFELNEEQKLIQQTARRIAKERVAPRAAEMDETGEYPHDVFEAFRDQAPDRKVAMSKPCERLADASVAGPVA